MSSFKEIMSILDETIEKAEQLESIILTQVEDAENRGYDRAIDDMKKIITDMRETATAMMWAESESACDRFLEQLKQLKAGE